MKFAYLFPGQGSHFVGMGKNLYDGYEEARALFDEADDVLGFSLSQLCFEGPEDDLTDTVNQQPALYVTSLATLAVGRKVGWPTADYMAGHSLGELSALAAAGAISFADGLRLVRRRGELMKAAGEAAPGGMAAILGMDAAQVADACRQATAETGHAVQVANDNCPGQIVISGHETAVERAGELAKDAGARRVISISITIAAHSALMTTAAERFAEVVDEMTIDVPAVPVVGNTTAVPLRTPEQIRAELKAQLTGPVRWTESMNYLITNGVEEIIEVGPGKVLQNLMKRINRKVRRSQFEMV